MTTVEEEGFRIADHMIQAVALAGVYSGDSVKAAIMRIRRSGAPRHIEQFLVDALTAAYEEDSDEPLV